MTADRRRPDESRRACCEPGCPKDARRPHALCDEHLRAALKQAFGS